MTRRFSTAAVMLAVTGSLLAQDQPRFGSRVDLVVVSAIVRDGQNALVRGLTQDDFELVEDGKPVAIATFAEINADSLAPQDDGRFIVLMMDDLVTDPVLATRLKQVASGFADRMGRRDVMSVVFLNGGAATTTSSPAQVRAAIDKFKPFGTSLMSSGMTQSHAMEAVSELAAQLAALPHRRKVLVCIGPTHHFNPEIGNLGRDPILGFVTKSIRESTRANLTTYVIDPLGLKERNIRGHLDGFARETGGVAFANVNTFEAAIEQVWQESGSYYLFGYEPARRDNRQHTIEIRAQKPDLQVRARRTRD